MASSSVDFSRENWNVPARIAEGAWVIAHKHNPGLNRRIELNNRTFVFQLRNRQGKDVLLVLGCAAQPAIDAVKVIAGETGLEVGWVVSNGGAHHLFLDLWYAAFPKARVLVPAKRIPFTANGKALAKKYADRWELLHGPDAEPLTTEFGDQIDVAIFDQLFAHKDETSTSLGGAASHASAPSSVGGFKLMGVFMKQMKDLAQPTDEIFFFHKASGLAIAGHNFQLSYSPKGWTPPAEFKLEMGGFPVSLMMGMMMPKGSFKSSFEGNPGPIADSKRHWETWERVLAWDFRSWTSAHDPPTVGGPDLPPGEIKRAIRESLARTGEDDPTGVRLAYNKKRRG